MRSNICEEQSKVVARRQIEVIIQDSLQVKFNIKNLLDQCREICDSASFFAVVGPRSRVVFPEKVEERIQCAIQSSSLSLSMHRIINQHVHSLRFT